MLLKLSMLTLHLLEAVLKMNPPPQAPLLSASSKPRSSPKGTEQPISISLAFIVNITWGVCIDVLKIILGQWLRWLVLFPNSDHYVKTNQQNSANEGVWCFPAQSAEEGIV